MKRALIGVAAFGLLVAGCSSGDSEPASSSSEDSKAMLSLIDPTDSTDLRPVSDTIEFGTQHLAVTPAWRSSYTNPESGQSFEIIGAKIKNTSSTEEVEAVTPITEFVTETSRTDYTLLRNYSQFELLMPLAANAEGELSWAFDVEPAALSNGILRVGNGAWRGDFTTLPARPAQGSAPATTTTVDVTPTEPPAPPITEETIEEVAPDVTEEPAGVAPGTPCSEGEIGTFSGGLRCTYMGATGPPRWVTVAPGATEGG
jgi:hypothetical protein